MKVDHQLSDADRALLVRALGPGPYKVGRNYWLDRKCCGRSRLKRLMDAGLIARCSHRRADGTSGWMYYVTEAGNDGVRDGR